MKRQGLNEKVYPVKTPPKRKKGQKGGLGHRIASRFGRAVLTIFLVGVITGTIVVGAIAIYVIEFVKPDTIDLNNAKLKFTSIVYGDDSSGKAVELAELNGGQNRIWVDLKDVPDNMKNAFISTEDQRFYEHEGVDWKRTVSAFANFFLHYYSSNQGGSTITQQLIKNINGDITNRTPAVKIREIVTALDLERRFSKDQILESYLNTIPLGESCYGVQTASSVYFGKDVKNLDLAQCALIAGLTQAPSYYDPLTHADRAMTRQKQVLKNMLKQKMITQEQYDAASKEKLSFQDNKTTTIYSWFVDQVIRDVQADLVNQKKCSTYDQALNYIYTQGLKIYSTEVSDIQQAMDTVYLDDNNKYWLPGKSGVYQSAMIVVDYTGKIVGMEGGRGQKTQNLIKNRAAQPNVFRRQPGSSIKPLADYGPAIESGLIKWSSVYEDSPITYKGVQWPHNDDYWSYQNMTVAEALAQSKNTIAVKIGQAVGLDNSGNLMVSRLGFTTIGKATDHREPSFAIGSGVYVTPEEMAGAYEVFGNGGLYTKPYIYTKVVDNTGQVILENKPSSVRAFTQETSTIMNKLLQNNVQTGTGYQAKLSYCESGGKTGTTDHGEDRWFVGLTPDYIGAVWSGYDDNKLEMDTENNPSAVAWHGVFAQLESICKTKSFPVLGNVVQGSDGGWYKATDTNVSK